jgi:hypothetical protein
VGEGVDRSKLSYNFVQASCREAEIKAGLSISDWSLSFLLGPAIWGGRDVGEGGASHSSMSCLDTTELHNPQEEQLSLSPAFRDICLIL